LSQELIFFLELAFEFIAFGHQHLDLLLQGQIFIFID
jgi:hypothetical protein